MQQKGTEIIGHWNCPVCGNVAPVKKSLRGRLSMVCKWQDDGCGSQLQTLTADASMMMMKSIRLIEQAKEQPAESMPKAETMQEEKPKKHKKEKIAKAPSVAESSWGLL